MKPARIIVASVALAAIAACDRSPSAPSTNEGLPQAADGRRTSIPGKAMDRAEDLKKDVEAYNQKIDDTIRQGTADEPPSQAKPPKKKPGPTYRPAEGPGSLPPSP